MRGFKTAIIAAVLLFVGLLSSACASSAHESTPQPLASDIQTAKDFLAKTKPEDGKNGDETWARGVVLHTSFDSSSLGGMTWSMTLLKPDGITAVFQSSLMSLPDKMNEMVVPGDYIAYKDDGDEFLKDTEVKVTTKAAVPITGK